MCKIILFRASGKPVRNQSENLSETCRKPVGNPSETSRKPVATSRKPLGNQTETSRKPGGNQSETSRKPVENESETSRKPVYTTPHKLLPSAIVYYKARIPDCTTKLAQTILPSTTTKGAQLRSQYYRILQNPHKVASVLPYTTQLAQTRQPVGNQSETNWKPV